MSVGEKWEIVRRESGIEAQCDADVVEVIKRAFYGGAFAGIGIMAEHLKLDDVRPMTDADEDFVAELLGEVVGLLQSEEQTSHG